jgi:hypothetical protein
MPTTVSKAGANRGKADKTSRPLRVYGTLALSVGLGPAKLTALGYQNDEAMRREIPAKTLLYAAKRIRANATREQLPLLGFLRGGRLGFMTQESAWMSMCGDPLGAQSTLYSVVLPSKCSLSASASWRVWWTTPSR